MEFEVVAFDVFGTLVDWHTSIAEALARVGPRAGIQADWPELANAWRARYHPTLNRVVEGGQPFRTLDVLHRRCWKVADEHGSGRWPMPTGTSWSWPGTGSPRGRTPCPA